MSWHDFKKEKPTEPGFYCVEVITLANENYVCCCVAAYWTGTEFCKIPALRISVRWAEWPK